MYKLLSVRIDVAQPSRDYRRKIRKPTVGTNTVHGGKEGCVGDSINGSSSNMVGKGNIGPNMQMPEYRNTAYSQDANNLNSFKVVEPHDGMEFESKESAFSFYKEYSKSVGFSVIIKASRRSRISGKFIDAKFACTRYGNKRDACVVEVLDPVTNLDNATAMPVKKKRGRINHSGDKTDCKASMHVKRLQSGRWAIHSFIKEHNHELFPDEACHSHGHMNLELGCRNVAALHATRTRRKRMFVTMSRQSGGCKKADKQKVAVAKQVYEVPHLAINEGDIQVMLDYFVHMQEENPKFFYSVDLNKQQRLKNVFWVDAKGRLDYANLGDVVFFDTTYIKNEYRLPFAPFIGINHHFQLILLGCSLVTDETKSTYAWLMRAWLRAMHKCPPKVILTKQDETLKEAIAEVFPDSRHCYCLWDIFGKIPVKLGHVIRQHENFMPDFNKCVFKSLTSEQFEKRWMTLVDRFNLSHDSWFKLLHVDRERWVPLYMKNIFLAGMSTRQRSDSINSSLDKYIQRKTTLKGFLNQYKIFTRDKCEEEAKVDFESLHKQPELKSPSPFGKQMAALYTHAIFNKFQVEVLGVVACHPKKESEDGQIRVFRVQDFEENQDFLVEWNEATSEITCLCRSFEFNGYLCRHAMIVLQISGIHSIPSQYLLTRWTKDAKSRQQTGKGSNVNSRAQRYSDLCQQAFRLSNEGSLSQESYSVAFDALEETLRKCESLNASINFMIEPSSSEGHGSHISEEVNQGNNSNETNKKNTITNMRQAHFEPEIMTIATHNGWKQSGHSSSQAPALDYTREAQDSLQGIEQLSTRAPTLESYYGGQQLMKSSDLCAANNYFSLYYSCFGRGKLTPWLQGVMIMSEINKAFNDRDNRAQMHPTMMVIS